MTFYPDDIDTHSRSPAHADPVSDPNAVGKSVSFECGSFAELSIRIDETSDRIERAGFRSNGCGYMIAAAEVVCDWLEDRALAGLHGLSRGELYDLIAEKLGEFPERRRQCGTIVVDALKDAMAAYRLRRIEEFQGEKALVCTCFGIAEEELTAEIRRRDLRNVDSVADVCRAGSGCGSCRMLIQELIETRSDL